MEIIYEMGDFRFLSIQHGDLELVSYFQFRTLAWNKEGWEQVPEGEFELDSFDRTATYCVVTYKGQVVSGFRLIYAESANILPFAKGCRRCELAKLKASKPGIAIEVSRWCTDRSFRGSVRAVAHKVMTDNLIMLLCSLGAKVAYMDVCDFLYSHFDKIGVLSKLGDLHHRPEGSGFYPGSFDPFASAEKMGLLDRFQEIQQIRACA